MSSRRRLLLASAGIAALAGAGASLGRPAEAQDETTSLMRELATDWTEIERAFEAGETGALRDAGLSIGVAARKLEHLGAPRGFDAPERFGELATKLGQLTVELEDLASREATEGIEQTLDAMRAACVDCHIRFRDDNETRGLFPAADNTLSGVVSLKDVDGEPLSDRSWVLLFLEPTVGSAPRYRHGRWNPKVSQQGRSFAPRVLPVVQGTTVDFPNDDTIFHNVFSVSKKLPFDLGAYEPGESRSVEMVNAGLIKIYCNIHPEMQASVVVLGAPWFALTDEAGRFAITGVPDGEYVLRAWNDRGVESALTVTLADGDWRTLALNLNETRRVLPHKNKFGKPYPDKY